MNNEPHNSILTKTALVLHTLMYCILYQIRRGGLYLAVCVCELIHLFPMVCIAKCIACHELWKLSGMCVCKCSTWDRGELKVLKIWYTRTHKNCVCIWNHRNWHVSPVLQQNLSLLSVLCSNGNVQPSYIINSSWQIHKLRFMIPDAEQK